VHKSGVIKSRRDRQEGGMNIRKKGPTTEKGRSERKRVMSRSIFDENSL